MSDAPNIVWLVAEYSNSDLLPGWHLYLRDQDPQLGTLRNEKGDWGWIRPGDLRRNEILNFLSREYDISGNCDGTLDNGAYHQIAQRFPVRRRRRCHRPVGAIPIQWRDGEIRTLEI